MKKLLVLLMSVFALAAPAAALATTCTGNHIGEKYTHNNVGDIKANIATTQPFSTVYAGNISYWIMANGNSAAYLQVGVIMDHGSSCEHVFYEYHDTGSGDTYYNIAPCIALGSTHTYEIRKFGTNYWTVYWDGQAFGPFYISVGEWDYAVESQQGSGYTQCNVAGANFTALNYTASSLYSAPSPPYYVNVSGSNLYATGS